MTRTIQAILLFSIVLAAGCSRKKALDECLQKNLDQCEAACMDPTTATSDIGLTCSAASSKYMKMQPPDLAHAELLLDRACNGGANEVCVTIGNRYHKGRDGITRDKAKARAYYQKACDANYKPGCDAIQKMEDVDAVLAGRDAGAPLPPPPHAPARDE